MKRQSINHKMKKILIAAILSTLNFTSLLAQNTPIDTTALDEIIVTYQADKRTPFTYQNLSAKALKVKSTGQEPSFLLADTPSITNYSDAGHSQGYSYFRLRGIDQTRVNITLDGVYRKHRKKYINTATRSTL